MVYIIYCELWTFFLASLCCFRWVCYSQSSGKTNPSNKLVIFRIWFSRIINENGTLNRIQWMNKWTNTFSVYRAIPLCFTLVKSLKTIWYGSLCVSLCVGMCVCVYVWICWLIRIRSEWNALTPCLYDKNDLLRLKWNVKAFFFFLLQNDSIIIYSNTLGTYNLVHLFNLLTSDV